MTKLLLVIFLLSTSFTLVVAQHAPESTHESLKWYPFEEGIKLAKKKDRFVIVDIYTDWCGWCKKMDKETFQDPRVVKYLNEHFVAVKLNAEEKSTIAFNGTIYSNPNPAKQKSTHQLATTLAGARLAYPTYVYLDPKGRTITMTQGYSQAEDILPLLQYIGSKAYKTKTWKEYTGLN